MTSSTRGEKIDKIALKIGSGIILSIIFLLLGYLINNTLGRSIPPSFENDFSKSIFLLFLGFLSGYNLASSLKKESSAYYFYTGIFFPIFLIVLYSLLTNHEYVTSIFIVLGLFFPLLFIHSGLVESHVKFKAFIDLFAKYIPSISVITIAIGDFGIPILEIYANFDAGFWGYIVGAFAACIILYLLWLFEQEY